MLVIDPLPGTLYWSTHYLIGPLWWSTNIYVDYNHSDWYLTWLTRLFSSLPGWLTMVEINPSSTWSIPCLASWLGWPGWWSIAYLAHYGGNHDAFIIDPCLTVYGLGHVIHHGVSVPVEQLISAVSWVIEVKHLTALIHQTTILFHCIYWYCYVFLKDFKLHLYKIK